VLRVSGLSAGYGRIPILADVSLEVAAKEAVGILGHNGMGKTTLLRTLVGQLPATAGQVEWAGADITGLPSHRRDGPGVDLPCPFREVEVRSKQFARGSNSFIRQAIFMMKIS